jgi:ABC-2 type transport system ATP-binding protein
MAGGPPIEIRNLAKVHGDIVAVDHVSLTVGTGDVFGYLGPNGASKTTSLRMMLGLIRPTSGAVRLFGRDPGRGGAENHRRASRPRGRAESHA